MSWRFNQMTRGELNVDPFESEFFATEVLDSVTDPLVREAVQNSLDAAASDDPVEVRFVLGQADDATREHYLGGIRPHAEAALGAAALPGPGQPLTFLAIEDCGTRGLDGDPEQYEDTSETGPKNDFYYFWRNVGRSRKEQTDRGRWGLGKTVFAAASRLQTFFGLTVRASDEKALLLGQAVLKIHRVGGQRYKPYGYYGRHEGALALPLEESDLVEPFERAFGLQRLRKPGLSILVPYPDPEITGEELVQSILLHYFHPLLSGKLQVRVETDEDRTVLQRDTLEKEIRRRGGERIRSVLPLLSLARWGLEPDTEASAELSAPPAGRAPKMKSELFHEADLQRLRKRFDAGQRLALGIRVPIQRAGGEATETELLLLLERDESIQKGEGHFVRQGITIGNPKARRPRGVRWILVVTDDVLSAFLGDAENPAHTEWQRSSPKFKEKYQLGPSTLDFVRSAAQNVVAILSRPAEGRDPDLLRNIFSLSRDSALTTPSGEKPATGPSDEGSTGDSDLGDLGRDGKLTLARVKKGFRLKGRVGEGAPQRLRVRAAYEVLRGNPFRRYSPLDFRLDAKPIRVRADGASVVAREENRMEVEIDEPVFDVLVTGFDENRDLRIKVEPERNGE